MVLRPLLFDGTEKIAETILEKQKCNHIPHEEIANERKKLCAVVETNAGEFFTGIEQTFLSMQVIVGDHTDSKKLLHVIAEHCEPHEPETTDMPQHIGFSIKGFSFEVTSTELTKHQFYYESKQKEIGSLVETIFQKLDMPILFHAFDHNQRPTLHIVLDKAVYR